MTRPPRVVPPPEHWMVGAFFNALWDAGFLATIERLLDGVGGCMNDACCLFYDPDEDSAPFEGAKFSVFEDEVHLTDVAWKAYAREALRSFLRANPGERAAVEALLARLR